MTPRQIKDIRKAVRRIEADRDKIKAERLRRRRGEGAKRKWGEIS